MGNKLNNAYRDVHHVFSIKYLCTNCIRERERSNRVPVLESDSLNMDYKTLRHTLYNDACANRFDRSLFYSRDNSVMEGAKMSLICSNAMTVGSVTHIDFCIRFPVAGSSPICNPIGERFRRCCTNIVNCFAQIAYSIDDHLS